MQIPQKKKKNEISYVYIAYKKTLFSYFIFFLVQTLAGKPVNCVRMYLAEVISRPHKIRNESYLPV